MAGQIHKLENLTYTELDAFNRDKTILLIAISPLEEHGPHLPVGVDAFNAAYFAQYTAEKIVEKHPDFDLILFPLLPVGTQVYKQIGSFYIKPETVYDITYSTGKSIAIYGFKYIFVFSAHGAPRQIVAIEAACRKISRRHKANMVSLTGALAVKFLDGEMYDKIAAELGRDFSDEEKYLLKYDYHAGWWETSMILKNQRELVKESYKNLKPYLKKPVTRELLTPDVKWQGYFGAPAKATPEFAEASIKVFAGIAMQLIDRCLRGEDISKDVTSPFYKYPVFHPFFKKTIIGAVIVVVIILLLALLLAAYL
jgi:creatinine amidohydrolase